jgi:hypothetical protein
MQLMGLLELDGVSFVGAASVTFALLYTLFANYDISYYWVIPLY